ncbi:MAG: hypothetical protein ACKPKO_08080, partial [Candidatus Fonsibacter sp.]
MVNVSLGGSGHVSPTVIPSSGWTPYMPTYDAECLFVHPPPKPKSPPLYCYIGYGVDTQPTCITSLVVRTNDAALTATDATVCR